MKEVIIETVKFTDVVKDITGGNRKFSTDEYLQDGKLPIIDQGQNLIGGYTNELSRIKRNKPVVVFGDHTKALKYVDFDFCLGADGVKILEPTDQIDTAFLYYYLSTQKLPDVGYSRHFKFLKEIEIPLFPLSAQKKAIAILDKADTLRKKDQQLLQYYDDLAQSLFIDMFGDPVKNEKGWEEKKMSQLGKLDRGVSKHRPRNAPELLGGKYPLVQTGDVANSGGIINSFKSTYSEIGLKQSKLWPKGTLCITIAANIAKTGVLNFEACFPDSIVGFVPNILSNNCFVQFWFQFLQKILEDAAPESAQKNINLDILRNLDVIAPPITLQNQFAEQIQNIEQQKEKLKLQMQESENLFQALLQKAFNGGLN